MHKLNIAFINPPHADWSLANNMTYLQCQSHYQRFGKYRDQINWLPAPYKWNRYEAMEEIFQEIVGADIVLCSSYTWNAMLLDEIAHYIREQAPQTILVIGGPHIGTNEPKLLAQRKELYDFICRPTKPGEVFVEDLIDQWFEQEGKPSSENISWELSGPKTKNFDLAQDYSVYFDHRDYLRETVEYARAEKMEPFVVLETTRGCPYKCVYCEWGGGTNTKIIKKPVELVKQDILTLKEIGFRDAYLTDANFGAFMERDFEIFKFSWEHNFNLTDISTVKTPNLDKRKQLVDYWFQIVGKGPEIHSKSERGADMWGETEYVSIVPTVSIQSVSDKAMKISERVDLKAQQKILLSEYINERCIKQGYPVPALELILAMPGSTLDDFYEEMNLIWNFRAWTSFRHDYMFLPDSRLNSPEYMAQYGIETVEVFSDIVDEDGVDNWNSLYRNKKSYFKTIRSCFSFSAEEMIEMWFMNNAANYLLRYIYPGFINYLSPPEFARSSYQILKTMEDFEAIYAEIYDIFNPETPARSIRKLKDDFRVIIIETFLKENESVLKAELMRIHFPRISTGEVHA